VALVERDTVGGTVITSGGAPAKTFRRRLPQLVREARHAAPDRRRRRRSSPTCRIAARCYIAKCHPLEDEESLARRRQYQQAKGTNEEGKYHG
jgi:hypothetical protein